MLYFVYKDITHQIVVSFRSLKRKERKDFYKQKIKEMTMFQIKYH